MSGMAPSGFPQRLLLGSAMWGWTIGEEEVFSLLDEWYALGLREIDCATNYPIDKVPGHFRKAEGLLADWIKANGVNDLRVMMKVGSINNMRTAECLLTKSFLLIQLDEYQRLLGSNLSCLMIHWDNREDAAAISSTLEALVLAREQGVSAGLSGIRHPWLYAELNRAFGLEFSIQVKHNPLQSDLLRYRPCFPGSQFIAYGINAGGLKFPAEGGNAVGSLAARGGATPRTEELLEQVGGIVRAANRHTGDEGGRGPRRPLLKAMHEVGMIFACYCPGISGIILGPSSVAQLRENIRFYKSLDGADFRDAWQQLAALSGDAVV